MSGQRSPDNLLVALKIIVQVAEASAPACWAASWIGTSDRKNTVVRTDGYVELADSLEMDDWFAGAKSGWVLL